MRKEVEKQSERKRIEDLQKIIDYKQNKLLRVKLHPFEIDKVINEYDYLASRYKYIKVVEHPDAEVTFNGRTYIARCRAKSIKRDIAESKENAICCILCLGITTVSGEQYAYMDIIDLKREMEIE